MPFPHIAEERHTAVAGGARILLALAGALWHKADMVKAPKETRERLRRLLSQALKLTERLPQHPETVQETPVPSGTPHPSPYHVERYGGTRYFALYKGDQLLAVTVYRKGAETVRGHLDNLGNFIFSH